MDKKVIKASIFGKNLEVIEDNKNEMAVIVRCPYCGEPTAYGDTAMISGIVFCPKCADRCVDEVCHDKNHDRKRYMTHDYQPFGK